MRFNVPQFIDIEDKIFGPFSFKQFIYILGGAGASFIAYSYLPLFIAFFIIAGVGTLSLALAFKEVNGRPFSATLEAAFRYFFATKLYLWKKDAGKASKKTVTAYAPSITEQSPIQDIINGKVEGKLDNLSWNLDVNNRLNA